jgi:hypothetical protein
MAIADKALFGFNSVDDLWRQEFIPGEEELPLRWNKYVEDCGTSPWKRVLPRTQCLNGRSFEYFAPNAGYFCGSSIHHIRRSLGKEVDGKLCFSGLNLLEMYYMCELYSRTIQKNTLSLASGAQALPARGPTTNIAGEGLSALAAFLV